MRWVMCALLTKANGPFWAQVEVQACEHARRQRVRSGPLPVRWRHGNKRAGLFTRDAALVWSGRSRPHGRQDGQASVVDLWRADETTEARSVVALSRVPR